MSRLRSGLAVAMPRESANLPWRRERSRSEHGARLRERRVGVGRRAGAWGTADDTRSHGTAAAVDTAAAWNKVAGVRWIASANRNYSLCSVDADEVPQEILQSAKLIANSVLNIDGGVDKQIMDFPHHLDGGWPDVHPDDAFVIYAQIQAGDFAGVSAMARGSPKQRRERGIALALVLAAAAEHTDVLTDEILSRHHQGLSVWVSEARQQFQHLEAAIDELPPAAAPREQPAVERRRAAPAPEAGGSAAAVRVPRTVLGRSSSSSDVPVVAVDSRSRSLELELEALQGHLRAVQAEVREAHAESRVWQHECKVQEEVAQRQRLVESSCQEKTRVALKDLREAREGATKEQADLLAQLQAAQQRVQALEAQCGDPEGQRAGLLKIELSRAEVDEQNAASQEREAAKRKAIHRDLVAELTAELLRVKVEVKDDEDEEEDPLSAASAGFYASG